MRKQKFLNSVLEFDNINDFPAAVWRQAKYDEIRTEMNARLAVIDADMQEVRDAFDTGNGPEADVIDLKQARHTLRRTKAPAIKAAVDALGSDNNAIHSFDVVAAFDAP